MEEFITTRQPLGTVGYATAEERKQAEYDLTRQRAETPLTPEEVDLIGRTWYPYSPQDVIILRLVATVKMLTPEPRADL